MESRWPPKSPHEALLSSPSGRQKARQIDSRTSPTPSPLRKSSANKRNRRRINNVDGDEDEETLQLQLQALEAKLKLKQLQRRKAQNPQIEPNCHARLRSPQGENVPPSSRNTGLLDPPKAIDVPASPQKRATAVPEARSPGRVLLGIDKGLKGKNVSLRRPPKGQTQHEDPFWSSSTAAGRDKNDSLRSNAPQSHTGPQKSFSERVAESRRQDDTRLEREARRQNQRSANFAVDQTEIDSYRQKAESESVQMRNGFQKQDSTDRGGFSREQILQAMNKPNAGVVKRSRTVTSSKERSKASSDIWINPNAEPDVLHAKPASKPRAKSQSTSRTRATGTVKYEDAQSSEHLFEPFSTTHLSRRLLPHHFLTRTFTDKSVLRIPDLLANVKSPDYSLPDDFEADYVVLGVLASKSTPLTHKATPKTTSSEPTTSLTEATTSSPKTPKANSCLHALLQTPPRHRPRHPKPLHHAPPAHKVDTGRFSLTLNSSDDTILEIGTARDLGWCKAVRKDGKPCSDWVDKRHTEVCEFHVDRVIERNRRGRMEVNGISAPFAPGGKKKGRTGFFTSVGKNGSRTRSKEWHPLSGNDGAGGLRREGEQYDRETSSRYFVAPAFPGEMGGGGGSAAQLLDREDMMTARGESKEERVRKRFAERERENEIRRRLGEKGNGAGSEYARMSGEQSARVGEQKNGSRGGEGDVGAREAREGLSSEQQGDQQDLEASRQALLGNKAKEVHLSPLKKASLKRKGMAGSESARKKTRFVTEKGIREAGRESIGGTAPAAAAAGHSEDELEIE
ncbi:uncharacterized protein KY384_000694 [Bacidia gigantensis]|uniref:uncharacterized protein n=1 Tax=Bacidia gigantensis TaxID=2732470 RepID=UPI001D03E09E|nr:uncharacterized protein KY384_000694 [Bacidia gigantensis]KAG8525932.1 hypothetical protein KY384_000694 [Bacidia gigantensis]